MLILTQTQIYADYRMEGNFGGGNVGEFGESSVIHQTKPSKLVLTINNLLVNLLIRQTFFRQILETSQFTKLPPPNFPSIW